MAEEGIRRRATAPEGSSATCTVWNESDFRRIQFEGMEEAREAGIPTEAQGQASASAVQGVRREA